MAKHASRTRATLVAATFIVGSTLGCRVSFGQSSEVHSCTLDEAVGTQIDAQPFLAHGFSARWNAATDRIAYMEPNIAGYYRVFTIKSDGSGRRA